LGQLGLCLRVAVACDDDSSWIAAAGVAEVDKPVCGSRVCMKALADVCFLLWCCSVLLLLWWVLQQQRMSQFANIVALPPLHKINIAATVLTPARVPATVDICLWGHLESFAKCGYRCHKCVMMLNCSTSYGGGSACVYMQNPFAWVVQVMLHSTAGGLEWLRASR
jgi:hypothetical protein